MLALALLAGVAAAAAAQQDAAGAGVPLLWNAAVKSASIALSNGDTTATSLAVSQAGQQTVLGVIGHGAGKHGFRVRIDVDAALGGENVAVGLAQASFPLDSAYLGFFGPSVGLYDDGTLDFANGSTVQSSAVWAVGGYIDVLYDGDAGLVWVGKNGVYDGNPAAGTGASATVTPGTVMYPAFGISGGADMQATMDAPLTLPAGFSPWSA